jgi:hypothetical protein
MIMDGELEYPEAAFNLVGTIDDAIAKGKKMLEEAESISESTTTVELQPKYIFQLHQLVWYFSEIFS